jgi:hypothetical protein
LAYLVSASAIGVLPNTPMVVEHGRLVLRFQSGFKALAGECLRAIASTGAANRTRAGNGCRVMMNREKGRQLNIDWAAVTANHFEAAHVV